MAGQKDDELEVLLLKDHQVATLLGLTRVSIHRLRSRGLLPRPLKLGGATRWRRGELERWIGAGCPDTGTWEKLRENAGKTPSGAPSTGRAGGRGRA